MRQLLPVQKTYILNIPGLMTINTGKGQFTSDSTICQLSMNLPEQKKSVFCSGNVVVNIGTVGDQSPSM